MAAALGAAVQPLNLRTRTGVDEPRFALGSSGPDRRPPGPLRYGPSSPVLAVRQHQHPSDGNRSDHLLPEYRKTRLAGRLLRYRRTGAAASRP